MDKLQTILYVAPRYHTNQVPIMEGLVKSGVQPYFMAMYEGVSEIHEYAKFELVNESRIGILMFKVLRHILSENKSENSRSKLFLPNRKLLKKRIKTINPDLVIIRDRLWVNHVVYSICRELEIPCVLYSQSTLEELLVEKTPMSLKDKFKSRLKFVLFPDKVFTPVLYRGAKRQHPDLNMLGEKNIYFIPLIVSGKKMFHKEYCKDGILRILEVAKYREYKNHYFLVDALTPLKDVKNLKVTVIGQLSNADEKEYYEKLKKYIIDKGLNQIVELRGNVPFEEMDGIYQEHDALVLPSRFESAGMAILEAMEQGMTVACSNNCGLGSYLDYNECGHVFGLGDSTELTKIINNWLNDKEAVEKEGIKARDVVIDKYGFEAYWKELTSHDY